MHPTACPFLFSGVWHDAIASATSGDRLDAFVIALEWEYSQACAFAAKHGVPGIRITGLS